MYPNKSSEKSVCQQTNASTEGIVSPGPWGVCMTTESKDTMQSDSVDVGHVSSSQL